MHQYKHQFEQDGFCIIKGAVKPETVHRANLAIDEFRMLHDSMLVKEGLLANNLLQRVINLHRSIFVFKDVFIESLENSSAVTDQYGRSTLYTSLFYELGSQQPLHRDTPYFFSGKSSGGYLGVWAALDDVDEENGPLIAIKGSHKLGEPDLEMLKHKYHPDEAVPPSSPPLFDAYNNELISLANNAGLEEKVFEVEKGDVIVWHPATLHGGMLHKNPKKTRRSFVMHVTPENMPIHHMDYFFDRQKKIHKVNKDYEDYNGRLIENGSKIDFMHKKLFDAKKLGFFK